jgi:hypothetical protein
MSADDGGQQTTQMTLEVIDGKTLTVKARESGGNTTSIEATIPKDHVQGAGIESGTHLIARLTDRGILFEPLELEVG